MHETVNRGITKVVDTQSKDFRGDVEDVFHMRIQQLIPHSVEHA